MMKPSKEDVMGYYYNKNHTQITRGKRAKRHGLQSQLGLTLASTSSSDHSGAPDHPYRAAPSPAPSAEFTASTSAEEEEGEEEDMANCLILLAQGHHSRKVQEKAAYECKTCNRCFASFQALGGHRASHKKLRANINTDEKKSLTLAGVRDYRFNNTSTTLSLQLGYRDHHLYSNNNKSKVHDCSICGAEFSSGQALGGHMRRHRTFMNTAAAVLSAGNTRSPPESHEARKKRNILQLDLNLPAPEDHDHLHRDSSSFSLVSKEPVLFFSSTSALVDCHY